MTGMLSGVKRVAISERTRGDLGTENLFRFLASKTRAFGGQLIGERVQNPLADLAIIRQVQAGVAAVKKALPYPNLEAKLDHAATCLKIERLCYYPYQKITPIGDFLKSAIELSQMLGALNRPGLGQNSLLANIQQALALTNAPLLTDLLKIRFAAKVTISIDRSNRDVLFDSVPVAGGLSPIDWKDHHHYNDFAGIIVRGLLESQPPKDEFSAVVSALNELDYLYTLARWSNELGWVQPQILDAAVYDLHGGSHPVLEAWHKDSHLNGSYLRSPAGFPKPTANTISLFKGPTSQNTMFVTGPNGCGKTSLLQQMGLTIILALMGSDVPAVDNPKPQIGLFDRLETLFGTQGKLGQSGLLEEEMTELKNIFGSLTDRTFLGLDEPCRSTESESARGLAHAWTAAMGEKAGIAVTSTHHTDRLNHVSQAEPHVKIAHMGAQLSGRSYVPTFELLPGVSPHHRYGVMAAKEAGLPDEVDKRL